MIAPWGRSSSERAIVNSTGAVCINCSQLLETIAPWGRSYMLTRFFSASLTAGDTNSEMSPPMLQISRTRLEEMKL